MYSLVELLNIRLITILHQGFYVVCGLAPFCKWFEPRSISSSYSVIVRVKVVLKRTVVGDFRRFDNLSGKSSSESSE